MAVDGRDPNHESRGEATRDPVLGVSTRSVERYVAAGRLKATHIGHLVRLRPGDVISFIDAGTIKPATNASRAPASSCDGPMIQPRGKSVVK